MCVCVCVWMRSSGGRLSLFHPAVWLSRVLVLLSHMQWSDGITFLPLHFLRLVVRVARVANLALV